MLVAEKMQEKQQKKQKVANNIWRTLSKNVSAVTRIVEKTSVSNLEETQKDAFNSCTVDLLKAFLQTRGIPFANLKKQQLVDVAYENRTKEVVMSDPDNSGSDEDEQQTLQDKKLMFTKLTKSCEICIKCPV